jgi:hypothetical protein
MGLSYDELFPGRFLKASVFKGRDVTLTIRDVRIEELPSETGGTKVKGIIAFEGKKLELVLNRTNGEALKAMWGRDTGDWIGKRVTLYPAMFNGEPCIRVRGSPDLPAPLDFELKLPRKRPQKTRLLVTGKANGKAAPAPEPETTPEPEPVVDTETGEVF